MKTRPSLPPRVITAHPAERAPCLHHWKTRRKGRPRAATAQRAEAPTHGRPARSEAGRASWPRCSSRPLFPSPLLMLRKRGGLGSGLEGRRPRTKHAPRPGAASPAPQRGMVPHRAIPSSPSRPRDPGGGSPALLGRTVIPASPHVDTLWPPVRCRGDPSQTTG